MRCGTRLEAFGRPQRLLPRQCRTACRPAAAAHTTRCMGTRRLSSRRPKPVQGQAGRVWARQAARPIDRDGERNSWLTLSLAGLKVTWSGLLLPKKPWPQVGREGHRRAHADSNTIARRAGPRTAAPGGCTAPPPIGREGSTPTLVWLAHLEAHCDQMVGVQAFEVAGHFFDPIWGGGGNIGQWGAVAGAGHVQQLLQRLHLVLPGAASWCYLVLPPQGPGMLTLQHIAAVVAPVDRLVGQVPPGRQDLISTLFYSLLQLVETTLPAVLLPRASLSRSAPCPLLLPRSPEYARVLRVQLPSDGVAPAGQLRRRVRRRPACRWREAGREAGPGRRHGTARPPTRHLTALPPPAGSACTAPAAGAA